MRGALCPRGLAGVAQVRRRSCRCGVEQFRGLDSWPGREPYEAATAALPVADPCGVGAVCLFHQHRRAGRVWKI